MGPLGAGGRAIVFACTRGMRWPCGAILSSCGCGGSLPCIRLSSFDTSPLGSSPVCCPTPLPVLGSEVEGYYDLNIWWNMLLLLSVKVLPSFILKVFCSSSLSLWDISFQNGVLRLCQDKALVITTLKNASKNVMTRCGSDRIAEM